MSPIAVVDLARQQHSDQHRALREAQLWRAVRARRQSERAAERARSAASRAERAGEIVVSAVAR